MKDQQWLLTCLVGGSSLLLFLFFASGHVQTIDVSQSIALAQRVVSRGTLSVVGFPELPGGGAVAGRDGLLYTTHDIGMTLIFLPIAASEHWGLLPNSIADLAYTAINPIFGAVLVAVVFRHAWRLSDNLQAAVWTAFILAGCTYLLPYARISFDAVPTATLLAASSYLVWRGIETSEPHRILLGGLCGGAAITVRTDSVIFLALLTCWVAWRLWPTRRRALWRWGAPLVAALALNAWFNWARYGSVLNTGHADDPNTLFRPEVWEGVFGQLISPAKGVVFFAPPVILTIFGWRTMLITHRGFGAALLAGCGVSFLFFASIDNWSGAEAVGPRFMLPVLVLLWPPTAYALTSWDTKQRATRAAIVGLCTVGAVVQIGLASTHHVAVNRMYGGDLSAGEYRSSQILYSWQAWWDGVNGRQPYPSALQGGILADPVPRFDIWWAGASQQIESGWRAQLIAGLVAVSAAALFALALRSARANSRRRISVDSTKNVVMNTRQ